MSTQPGRLFIVSAASGTGKTTLVTWLIKSLPQVRLSVSHTTRAPRAGEQDGLHYNFASVPQFEEMLGRAAFLEHAVVHGNYYGTSQEWVEATLKTGTDVILEIDWQGAAQVRHLMPDCIAVFILPPSRAALETRLRGRGQDAEDVIRRRLQAARDEMAHCFEYDYLIVNDDLDTAKQELAAVFVAERCRTQVQGQRHSDRIADLLA